MANEIKKVEDSAPQNETEDERLQREFDEELKAESDARAAKEDKAKGLMTPKARDKKIITEEDRPKPVLLSGKTIKVKFIYPRKIDGTIFKKGINDVPVEFLKYRFFRGLEARQDVVVLGK